MTDISDDHLGALARLARDIERKRDLHAQIHMEVEKLQRGGMMVVTGEISILEILQKRLDEALKLLEEIGTQEEIHQKVSTLAQLADTLSDGEWQVLDEIQTELKHKAQMQEQRIGEFEEHLTAWKGRVSQLQEALNEGRLAKAPIFIEEREVARIDAVVSRAERTFREQQYGAFQRSLDDLAKETGNLEELTKKIGQKITQAQEFARQADLLLLQSPLDINKRYLYTVLLRTPSEPGTHGINIQDSSTLAEQDRRLMSDEILKLTQAIDQGLAREFSRRALSVIPDSVSSTTEVAVAPESLSPTETRHLVPGDQKANLDIPANLNVLIEDVGELMYRLFMPEQMQRYLIETPCSLTITTNDLELPWELMHYNGQALCLQRPVSRMPMGYAYPNRRSRSALPSTRKIRFLLIYSDPEGQPSLPAALKEVEAIETALQKEWKDRIDIVVLKRQDVTGRRLNEILRKGAYDVIHYAGHAYFDNSNPDLSGLMLHDKEVFIAQKIRRLLEGRPLVFLNACESGRTANEHEPQKVGVYFQKPAEGLASAFIYGGALGCIGCLWPIYDRPAADFAIHFYRQILDGHMIGEAMRLARVEIKNVHPEQITWAAFVLYGDSTFRLVR